MAVKPVHVVAAVIKGAGGEVLIAKRPDHLHQGGKWEFPGGKVEPGEPVTEALCRELNEELGITPVTASPLIQVEHHYRDKSVFLDVWEVSSFEGCPRGMEGQPIEWVKPAQLPTREFPGANQPIVRAAMLPDSYLITPDPFLIKKGLVRNPSGQKSPGREPDLEQFLRDLGRSLEQGVRLVQLRSKQLGPEMFGELAREAVKLCRQCDARLLLNGPTGVDQAFGADGFHLTTRQLQETSRLPEGIIGASCHSPDQIALADKLGVDFITLSPVQPTRSHPHAEPLGWRRFAKFVREAKTPVYALGGLALADRQRSREMGAQGIAGISGLWAGSIG